MYCKFCNLEFENSGYTYYCSRSCYDKHYYRLNKEKRDAYFKEHYKKTYIPRPKPPKVSEEAKKARALAYYNAHKEYYKQKAHEHYLRNKNNPEYKKRKNEANKRYQERRRLNVSRNNT